MEQSLLTLVGRSDLSSRLMVRMERLPEHQTTDTKTPVHVRIQIRCDHPFVYQTGVSYVLLLASFICYRLRKLLCRP